MALRGLVLGAAFLAAGLVPAVADSVTASVETWNPTTRTLVLSDKTQFQTISSSVAVPDTLAAGKTVTIVYDGSESGVDSILSIEVQP
ncbi:hypothetical protein SIAM614_20520 [Stappia aggregata IAM 12614]|uniref:DUF5666 domain-containing protein n=1 Tax=Roseibium aggregatum (strain ATCC 25650 / DSM 13394 / JCM 20685 / NBRC 16684 / NCIMB 2208 / IAM 12614 / B1) TaxID=384765 RepID=A0NYB5_ROSAI|nr:hypothetical protein [Roseibium aggregatum]EAV42111.1 hypothetical protein SIAM614_20520 [Stappia aggregata IAM 12614] [Roseibium aggregatum IAM 12614]